MKGFRKWLLILCQASSLLLLSWALLLALALLVLALWRWLLPWMMR